MRDDRGRHDDCSTGNAETTAIAISASTMPTNVERAGPLTARKRIGTGETAPTTAVTGTTTLIMPRAIAE